MQIQETPKKIMKKKPQKDLDLETKFATQLMNKYKMTPGELCQRCDFNTIYLNNKGGSSMLMSQENSAMTLNTPRDQIKRIDNELRLFDGLDMSINALMVDERDPFYSNNQDQVVDQLSNTYLDSINHVKSVKNYKSTGQVKIEQNTGAVSIPSIPLKL